MNNAGQKIEQTLEFENKKKLRWWVGGLAIIFKNRGDQAPRTMLKRNNNNNHPLKLSRASTRSTTTTGRQAKETESVRDAGKFGLAGKFEMFRNRCCGNLVRPRLKLKPCNRVTRRETLVANKFEIYRGSTAAEKREREQLRRRAFSARSTAVWQELPDALPLTRTFFPPHHPIFSLSLSLFLCCFTMK